MADLTRIMTGEGVLWLASARDAFSNRVVGWATAARADTTLVLRALEYGLWSRDVRAGQLIHHSDKGCQYTAVRFTQRLVDAGVAPSTGSVGDSYDNAVAENLWSAIKVELLYWPGTTFATRAQAEAAIFRYIDGWYNPRRIQVGLGGLSPDEYEAAAFPFPRPGRLARRGGRGQGCPKGHRVSDGRQPALDPATAAWTICPEGTSSPSHR